MNTKTRIITFGIISGLIWSVIAELLSGGFGVLSVELAFLLSGILTGLLVSCALKSPLQKYGRWSGFVFGALSLPLGAFVFGSVSWLVGMATCEITGASHFPLNDPSSNPLQTGFMFAFLSILPWFVVFLLPLAILTTFIFRAIVRKHETTA